MTNLTSSRASRSLVARLAAVLLFAGVALSPVCALADGEPNAFNPYTGKPLPSSRALKDEEAKILRELGGKPRSIASDASWRKNWKEEIYPVVRGSRSARHEVIVLLDMADPASRPLWKAVAEATKGLPEDSARVVLFGRSRELYATDLIGMAVWASVNRRGQAVEYVDWALRRWDEIKAGQKKAGRVKAFNNEYDAVLTRKDYPMTFTAMSRFKPAVPEKEQSELATYAYEAGNVNLFQATEVASFYGVERFPAVVVDGKVLKKVSASALKDMLR